MKISLMLEGQQGLTWPRWRRIAELADQLGFAGLFRSDHFTDPAPPNRDSLELVVSLTYLATQTRTIHFGPCVAPVSFRDPVMFARQAMHIDDLSGGRMILGLGAGWQEREHAMFGYPLGDIATRMARFEEALEVVWRLLRDPAPVSFEGAYYTLRDAELLPRPQRPGGPRIMIGGNGPKRTLPLAARYADIWNGVYLAPDEYRERSASLDRLLTAAGRDPRAVQRTHMTALYYGHDQAALNRRLTSMAQRAGETLDQLHTRLHEGNRRVVGATDQVVAQIQAYSAAGVEELYLQWLDLDDLDGLRSFAEHVLPRLD